MLVVEKASYLCSIQDVGRTGQRHIGVSRSGAMDTFTMRLANIALGNTRDAACIELYRASASFVCEAQCWVCVSGPHASVSVRRAADTRHPEPAEGSPCLLEPGDLFTVTNHAAAGTAYLAIAGGIDCPVVMGARATDLAGGFGGHLGRPLQRGDRIKKLGVSVAQARPLAESCSHGSGFRLRGQRPDTTLRYLPGPEYGEYSRLLPALSNDEEFLIDISSNRMGMRLSQAAHQSPPPAECLAKMGMLFSHAVAPGTIQLLPSGDAIILCADAQTTGGYPRLGKIIEADLWKLAQLPLGGNVTLVQTSLDNAFAAGASLEHWLERATISVASHFHRRARSQH